MNVYNLLIVYNLFIKIYNVIMTSRIDLAALLNYPPPLVLGDLEQGGIVIWNRSDGRDGRLRLLPLVHEPEQLRVRLAAPEADSPAPVAARGAGAAAWQARTISGPLQCAEK